MSDNRGAIEAGHRAFMEAFRRQDVDAMASLYTTAGQLYPAHSDVVTGTRAIARYWKSVFDEGLRLVSLTMMELETTRDNAVERGRYTLKAGNGRVLDEGKYIAIWRLEDADWKIHLDIWNTSWPREVS